MSRATMSPVPPGAYETTRCTVRLGNVCARAGMAAAAKATSAAMSRDGVFMWRLANPCSSGLPEMATQGARQEFSLFFDRDERRSEVAENSNIARAIA